MTLLYLVSSSMTILAPSLYFSYAMIVYSFSSLTKSKMRPTIENASLTSIWPLSESVNIYWICCNFCLIYCSKQETDSCRFLCPTNYLRFYVRSKVTKMDDSLLSSRSKLMFSMLSRMNGLRPSSNYLLEFAS